MAGTLQVEGVSKHFGGVVAVDNLDLKLEPGVLTALIGPNGAGKTTVFNVITGNIAPDSGRVLVNGKATTGSPPHVIARLGVGRTFQGLNLFDQMTVRENIQTAMETSSWFWQPESNSIRAKKAGSLRSIMEDLGLSKVSESLARDLSFAQRKFLSLARLKATDAGIWLLDEPVSGLDFSSRADFVAIVRAAVAAGTTVCLIEHNLDIVLQLANRIAFLDRGRKLAEGLPDEIMGNPALADVYFGSSRK